MNSICSVTTASHEAAFDVHSHLLASLYDISPKIIITVDVNWYAIGQSCQTAEAQQGWDLDWVPEGYSAEKSNVKPHLLITWLES